MQYRYFIVDVFTSHPFGGNPLAVLPEASGLSGADMQRIAREFNFSESTFVLPPPAGSAADFEVRIFTPTREVPFAGHPNVGTAFALAQDGVLGEIADGTQVVFAEQAGDVPVRIVASEESLWCELRAPQALQTGAPVDVGLVARILGLDSADIRITSHAPQTASVGLEFLMVELSSAQALARARIDGAALTSAADEGLCADIHCYVRDGSTIDARMFAPLDGVPEDPATGSANCALVALLSALDARADGDFDWQITQGVLMGRPSQLSARTEKRGGRVSGVWIGGNSVLFAEGSLSVGD